MSDLAEAELIARCRQGDEQAFRELVDLHKGLVFGVMARSNVDRSRVEDLAQEVFLRIHRGLPYFRGDAKLTTWIFRIVLNLLSQESEKRRASREVALDPERPAHQPRAEDRSARDLELRDRLEKALARLPPNYRLLIAGHYLHDVKYEDLAEALDIPVGTVKTHLHRAKKQLRALLEADVR
ncbi:MAG: RNA polymerase sigma factor [Vicinamibacterales bacterium]